ncbi:serine/threonine protein kinase [Piscinibacter sakaiensis]|uniref:Serine/threonine protein kinase n=1 Tax=Piscinibacter sakaiensis TaxID=1547922 RepID=A0A0K8P429_PISS1|nr:cache domain-containing protein [Piscinibacter sakaiensis]GAP37408.1 hypothetical protein ISF6_3263 [Piscinibacter sakaiensis]
MGADVRADGPARAAARGPKPTLALPAGFRLHEYRVDRVLGQGGFGITYLATDVHLNARVAIKEYLPAQIAFRTSERTVSPNASEHLRRYRSGLEAFLVEARTLASFRHPAIVRVARFFEANRTAYMVLEYERGESLKAWWARQGAGSASAHDAPPAAPAGGPAAEPALDPADAARETALLRRLAPLLDGLQVVHDAGFLHRDIKPDNIQVRRDGSWVLLDFGSARQALPAPGSGAEDVALTPGYAPIEQYLDDAQGAWTDVYALGATLYWMIAGRKPPTADERRHADPMRPAAVLGRGRWSPAVLAAVDWALRPRAADRPQSVADWRQALYAGHAGLLDLGEALRRAGPGAGETPVPPLRWRAGPRALWADLRRRAAPAHWSLGAKATAALLLAALLPMALTGLLHLRGSLDAVADGERRNLQLIARSTAGRLAQLVGDSQKLSRAIGTDPAFVEFLLQRAQRPRPAARPAEAGPGAEDAVEGPSAGLPTAAPAAEATTLAALRGKLGAIVATNPDLQLLMLMDRSGTAVVSSDPEVMGRNFAFREYFQAARAGREHVTGVVVGAVAGEAGVFFATPVRTPDAGVLGAVVLRLRASAIAGVLDEVRAGTPRQPWLIDADGVVLHHPDPQWRFRSLVPLAPAVLERIRADQRFRRDRIESLGLPALAEAVAGARVEAGGGGHLAFRSPRDGEPEVAGHAPVPGLPWTVVVSEPEAYFEAPVDRLATQLAAALLLVGVLAGLGAWLLARGLTRPVLALTRAAEALKRGDYAGATLTVRRHDELGRLARTFNVMIDVLRQREREGRAPAAEGGR